MWDNNERGAYARLLFPRDDQPSILGFAIALFAAVSFIFRYAQSATNTVFALGTLWGTSAGPYRRWICWRENGMAMDLLGEHDFRRCHVRISPSASSL